MADIAKATVTVLALLFAMVRATSVEIIEEWKPNIGWQLTCTWSLYMNDSLQSVKLFKNKQQFMIFRPELKDSENGKTDKWHLAENVLVVECVEAVENGVKGKCVLTVSPLVEPRRDFTFGCEVSGERPYFRIAEKEVLVKALVPPSPAVMQAIKPESGPISLNCTSTGLPPPSFVWTVNDFMVPHDFHVQSVWNSTTKLYTSWSTFTPQSSDLSNVKCIPEVAKGTELLKGESGLYSSANRRIPFMGPLILTIMTLLI